MASSMADKDSFRDKTPSNSSRRVRIIGKIRPFTDQESESLSQDTQRWITLRKLHDRASENRVRVSFLDQYSSRKDASYELDYCYEQDEDTKLIFSREIQPLVSDIFCGKSASIIAYGAKGSGKTFTIQGTEKNRGLAMMALTDLLPKAEETEKSVSVSLCEVSHERVYDLVDPNHSEVQILEDARGKLNLKGLSQVTVKSISEFQNAYFGNSNPSKAAHKTALDQPKKSHKVMIINVFDNSTCKPVGKMNFIDLAGYTDARRTSTDGSTITESTRINKSLNAVLNVIYALNSNESHVPYRESKLTRMLKESLGGRNHVLLLTCLNPVSCQDTIHTVSLASWSRQSINHVVKGSARPQMLSSQKIVKTVTTPVMVKKQIARNVLLSAKKGSAMWKGREPFDTGKKVISMREKCKKDADHVKMLELPHESDSDLAVEQSREKEVSGDKSVPDSAFVLVPCNEVVSEDKSIIHCSLDQGLEEVDVSANKKSNSSEASPVFTLLENDDCTGKKDECLQKIKGPSAPLSEKLREISNNLKLFCSTTPLRAKMPEELDKPPSAGISFTDTIEPKTPTTENFTRYNEKLEIIKYSSPWEKFNQRSSGMKNTLVEDYLQFLNSASKEELKKLKGIGEKRATYILELREESPEPFKRIEDLEDIGLSAKQVKSMMKKVAGELFS